MFVIARTDASDVNEIMLRAKAFAEAGADAVLVDALRDLSNPILKGLNARLRIALDL